jgi:hypothetical protein
VRQPTSFIKGSAFIVTFIDEWTQKQKGRRRESRGTERKRRVNTEKKKINRTEELKNDRRNKTKTIFLCIS